MGFICKSEKVSERFPLWSMQDTLVNLVESFLASMFFKLLNIRARSSTSSLFGFFSEFSDFVGLFFLLP